MLLGAPRCALHIRGLPGKMTLERYLPSNLLVASLYCPDLFARAQSAHDFSVHKTPQHRGQITLLSSGMEKCTWMIYTAAVPSGTRTARALVIGEAWPSRTGLLR